MPMVVQLPTPVRPVTHGQVMWWVSTMPFRETCWRVRKWSKPWIELSDKRVGSQRGPWQMRSWQPWLPVKLQVEISEEGNRPLYWSSGKEVAMQVPTIDSSICAWRIIPSPSMSSSACWTCTRCFTSAHTEPGLECLFHLKASEK